MGSLTFCGMWWKFCRGPTCSGGSREICWTQQTLLPSGFASFSLIFSSLLFYDQQVLLKQFPAFAVLFYHPLWPFQPGIEWNWSILSFTLSVLFSIPFFLFLNWIFLWLCLSRKVSAVFRGKVGLWICRGDYFCVICFCFGDYSLVGFWNSIWSKIFPIQQSLQLPLPFSGGMKLNGIELNSLLPDILFLPLFLCRLSCEHWCFDDYFEWFLQIIWIFPLITETGIWNFPFGCWSCEFEMGLSWCY